MSVTMSRQDCKVFIGGLSWETSDQKLRAYFENYGAVQEAFVSYDRNTGRPRGFGFVVFENADVADKVVASKHTIDRREVEAKKAVPKDDNNNLRQHPGSQSSKTKKIFVGGLPPSVDEKVLRQYFEQFGAMEDTVVMYDHENKRPRGFGFITFVNEESVEKVFNAGPMQSIHEKQIEIKPAVPRDQMPPVRRHFTYPSGKTYPPRLATYTYQQQAAAASTFRPYPGPHAQRPVHPHMVSQQLPAEPMALQQQQPQPQSQQHSQHTPRSSTTTSSSFGGSAPAYQGNGNQGVSGVQHAVGAGIPNLSTTYGMTTADDYSTIPTSSGTFSAHSSSGNYSYVNVNDLSQQLAQGLTALGKLNRLSDSGMNPTVKAFTGLPAGLQFDFTSRATNAAGFTRHEPSTLTSGDPEVQVFDVTQSRPATRSSNAGSTPFNAFPEPTFASAPAPGWSN